MSKRHFFPILDTFKIVEGRDYALGDAYERPRFRPKSSPPAEWMIFDVFRGLGSEGRRLGARPHHRALVALGRSWGIWQRTRVEPAEPNFRADAHRRLRRITWPSDVIAVVGLKAIEWGPAASEIYSLCFFGTYSWNHGTRRFFLGASGEGLFPKAPAKGFS